MSTTRALRQLAKPTFSASRSFSSTTTSKYAKMQVIGRLAAAPELVNTSTGKDIVKYSLASSYGPKDNQQTSWWRVASFLPEGAQRDFVLGLPKGTLVHLDADAQMNTYEDSNQKTQSSLSLIQRSIEVLARPKNFYENTEPAAEERQAASA